MVTTLITYPVKAYNKLRRKAKELSELSSKDCRYINRETLRAFHRPNSNPAKCGKVPISEDVEVWIYDGSAWFSGLVVCNQIWACPVCAYRIAIIRGKLVQMVIDGVTKLGGQVHLATLTIPHDQGDNLKPLRQTVASAFTKVIRGRPWKTMQEKIGYIGYVKALEVTHGFHGWHPHLHVLFFCDHVLSEAQEAALWDFLSQRWADAIGATRYRRPSREHGLVLSHGKAAGHYVTKIAKQGLAQEIGSSDTKQGRNGSRSINEILFDYHAHKRESDDRLIKEWLDGMYGARQLTWSNGLRKRYLPVEQAELDLDLDQESQQPSGERVAVIPGRIFSRLYAFDHSLPRRLIKALERSGREAMRSVITEAYNACPDCPTIPP